MSVSKVQSTFISLKIAKTATGSVAEIKEPKAKLSLAEKFGKYYTYASKQKNKLDRIIAMKVPKNA